MRNSFFDGDGVYIASMRFVIYDSKVRRRILQWEGTDTAVTMSQCEIKCKCHDGDGLEVHVRNSTEVVQSKKDSM